MMYALLEMLMSSNEVHAQLSLLHRANFCKTNNLVLLAQLVVRNVPDCVVGFHQFSS
jgi:hypothetical protein